MEAILEKFKKLIDSLREKAFHGKVTIHFAHGVPKKIETTEINDF